MSLRAGAAFPDAGLGVQEYRGGGAAHLRDGIGEVVLGRGMDGEIVPDPVQAGGAPGDPVGKFGGVLSGGVGDGITQPAVVGVQTPRGFQAGALASQPGGGQRGRQRLDVFDEVQAAGPGKQHLRPGQTHLRRVPGDGQGGGVALTHPQVSGCGLDT